MGLREKLALLGILILALGLRVGALRAGLDFADARGAILDAHRDELGMVTAVQERFLRGSLNPDSFLYRGPACFLLFGSVDALAVAGLALAHERGWDGARADLERNPSVLHLVHRALSALAGVLSVWLLVRIVRREFDAASGLAAGLVLATAYAHVAHSQYGATDVIWSLTTLACLDQMLRLMRDPRPGRYLCSGLLIGVSTATKYFGAMLALPLLAAHWIARAEARRAGAPVPRHGRVLLGLAMVPLGFLLLFPGLFVAARDFVTHLARGVEVVAPRAELTTPLSSIVFHLRYTLWVGLGEPVFLLALVGMWLAWRRGAAGKFLVISLLLLAPMPHLSRRPSLRYGLPLLAWLAAPAGIALAQGLRRLPGAAAVLGVVLVVSPSVARAVTSNRLRARGDTRVEMLAAILERAQPREDVLAFGNLNALPTQAGSEPGRREPYRSFILLFAQGKLDVSALVADPPRTILLDLSQASYGVPGREELLALLRARYREVLRLSDHVQPGLALPDPGMAAGLYVPYSRPWAMTRPGPPLVLYERVDP